MEVIHHNGERPVDLLRGTLDVLILRTLLAGPAHGHDIIKAIERGSDDVLQVERGSLCPALQRLAERGWVDYEMGFSENGRRAKFFRLTDEGRLQLRAETERWDTLADAIGRVLHSTESA